MSGAITNSGLAFAETVGDSGAREFDAVQPARHSNEPDPLLGARLDHFRVLRSLGAGGMGAVYAALDESLDREVALKVLHPEYASDPALRERFIREARAQARLHCPNVVHLYYVGQGDDRLYFAMELVEGVALDKFIEQRGTPLDANEALDAMAGVATALREAHRHGFIHRDIKPGNLLRASDGTVKLADFGLARPVTADSKITQAGMVIGSPAYMSPEQALGGDVDLRSDIYSLGATFFHLTTGHPPYEGPTPIATITKHITEAPPSPDRFGPLPKPLVQLLLRMLEKKPADRFADYDELLAAIEAARPQKVTYAGVPTRIAVSIVDQTTFVLLAAALGVWSVPIFAAYVTAALTMRGQTLGDRFFRVHVTREDGAYLSPWRALWRHVVCHWFGGFVGLEYVAVNGVQGLQAYLTPLRTPHAAAFHPMMLKIGAAALGNGVALALYIVGMAIALFDRRRRTLHDRAAGAVVTYRL